VLNFQQTSYVDPQNGQTYRRFDMDRDGFTLLAMGFNGKKALDFRPSGGRYSAVRVIIRDGEPWFVLADVCKVLEINNPRDAASRLDDDEKGVVITDTLGGPQKTTVISESGLYSVVMTSRKPEAKVFKRWVTGMVLPTIRKTGTYTVPTALPATELPTIDLTDSALVLAIITAQATKAIAEGKRAVTDTLRCRRLG
jgi:prophage antirepressor-like protein